MTTYIVLRRDDTDPGRWEAFPPVVDANSASAAIRHTVLKEKAENGVWVAVPLTSWHPTPIQVEVKRQLRLGKEE